jgi:ABC-type sugar transport system permease subunit
MNFLGDPASAMPTIAMIEVWKGLGFWAILFLSGLLALPLDLYHAAELDGAGPVRRFFSLTLPLMKPTFYFAVIFATIVNLQLFDSVFVLTDGGPVNSTATIAWYIYRSLFTFSDPGFGATLSFVLVIVVVSLTALQSWLMRARV